MLLVILILADCKMHLEYKLKTGVSRLIKSKRIMNVSRLRIIERIYHREDIDLMNFS